MGINGGEFIALVLIALLILGPDRIPEYTRKLADWLRQLRGMAEGAKQQFKEETGADFDEIDWRKYDPRQYDPRRIIRDALREPVSGTGSTAAPIIEREDLDGGLSREDLRALDPRNVFRRPADDETRGGITPTSSTSSAPRDSGPTSGATMSATPASPAAAPAATTSARATEATSAPALTGGGVAVLGGAAAALMASGQAEALVRDDDVASSGTGAGTPSPMDSMASMDAAEAPLISPERVAWDRPFTQTEHDPLDLLGLAPAPFDADAT
ncbi:MAG: Sec-independent protein translocase TatB [Micrococcus sp.]|nr:Sec-independent protein translocase TatB [Micrococcus sp.]